MIENIKPEQIASEFMLTRESGWLANGQHQRNAWPRTDAVSEAVSEVAAFVARLQKELDVLTRHLQRATDKRWKRRLSMREEVPRFIHG